MIRSWSTTTQAHKPHWTPSSVRVSSSWTRARKTSTPQQMQPNAPRSAHHYRTVPKNQNPITRNRLITALLVWTLVRVVAAGSGRATRTRGSQGSGPARTSGGASSSCCNGRWCWRRCTSIRDAFSTPLALLRTSVFSIQIACRLRKKLFFSVSRLLLLLMILVCNANMRILNESNYVCCISLISYLNCDCNCVKKWKICLL